jgi:hypothetical protein
VYGFYARPDEAEPVVLLANPEDQVAYAAKGFAYLGEAPAPGHATPAEVAAVLAKLVKAKK